MPIRTMVNYPHKVAKKPWPLQRKHPVDFANRGMTFEKWSKAINLSFSRSSCHPQANTDSNRESGLSTSPSRARLFETYSGRPSTTDYSGVQGRWVFEAKETQQKAIHADEKNFHQHQIDHMGGCPARRYLFPFWLINLLTSCSCINSYYNIDHGSKSIALSIFRSTAF